MSDIFISYSSKDRTWVEKLAKKLGKLGLDVWWDPEIKPGQAYRSVIQTALDNANCVIVVWSENSVSSIWVQSEATQAVERDILVPISLDNTRIPMPFSSIQTVHLGGKGSNLLDKNLDDIISGINIHCNSSFTLENSTKAEEKANTNPKKIILHSRRKKYILISLVVLLPVAFIFIFTETNKNNIYRNKIEKKETTTIAINSSSINNDKKFTENIKNPKEVINKLAISYKEGDIDLGDFKIEFVKDECLKDTNFIEAEKGRTILFSYYYLLILIYLDKEYSEFSYPHYIDDNLTFKDTLSNLSAEKIIKLFGKHLDNITKEDRKVIYSILSEMKNSYEKFISNKNEINILYLNTKEWLKAEDFYDSGFPKHKNSCFLDSPYLEGVKVKGSQSETYYSTQSLDLYLYNFWLRRYNDETMKEVKSILDFALWSLKN